MATITQETRAPQHMTGRHRLILVLLLGAQFMLALDFSILNVALPDIGKGLHFSIQNLQWIPTAFALTSAGFTLLFGRVADLAGRRRMFLIGMGLLAVASLIGGLATTQAMLLTGRVVQGLATAIVTPAALSLLTTSFPEGPMRDRALGLNGALLSAGFTTGAVLGGVLTGLLSWRWAFLINVPVGLVVFVVSPFLLRENRIRTHTRLDIPGAVTVTSGLLALVYGITSAARVGWGDRLTLGSLALAAVLLVAFWIVELRAPEPLVPLRVLRRPTVSWGNFGGAITFTMESSVVFLTTLYLQRVLGFSPLVTGLAFGLLGAAAFFAGAYGGRIIGRIGSHRALVVGLVVQSVSTAALFLVGDSKSWFTLVLVATAIGGFGHVLAIVGYMVTATSGLPNSEQGLATGLTSMTQQVSLTLGIPIMSAIATARIDTLSATKPMGTAILGGVTFAFLVDAAVVLLGAVLIGVFLRGRRVAAPAQAETIAVPAEATAAQPEAAVG